MLDACPELLSSVWNWWDWESLDEQSLSPRMVQHLSMYLIQWYKHQEWVHRTPPLCSSRASVMSERLAC